MYVSRREPDGEDLLSRDVTTVEVRIDDNHAGLAELLEEFGNFLRGCSFSFDGDVDVVDGDFGADEPTRAYVTRSRVDTALHAALKTRNRSNERLPDDFIDTLHAELNRDEDATNADV